MRHIGIGAVLPVRISSLVYLLNDAHMLYHLTHRLPHKNLDRSRQKWDIIISLGI
jgi:hypothetical protein